MKKNFKFLAYYILPVLIVMSIFSQIYVKKRGRINFEKFNNANIKDILSKDPVTWNKGGIKITIKQEEYVIFPGGYKNLFEYTAEKGDSIIKPAKKDTIILKKPNGSVYKYSFH